MIVDMTPASSLPVPVLINNGTGPADFSGVAVSPEAEERLRLRAQWYPFGSAVHYLPDGSGDDPPSMVPLLRLWTCETGVLRSRSGEEVLCLVARVDILGTERPEPGHGMSADGVTGGTVAQVKLALQRVLSQYPDTGIFAENSGLGRASFRLYIPHHHVDPVRSDNSSAPHGYLGSLTQLWGTWATRAGSPEGEGICGLWRAVPRSGRP